MEIIQGSLGSNKQYLLYHCGVIDISRPHPADSAALPSGMSPNGQLEEGKVFVWILLIYMWSLPLNFLVVSPKPSAADCKKRKEKKRKMLCLMVYKQAKIPSGAFWPLAVDPLGPTRSDWGAHWVRWGQTNLKRFNKVNPIQFTSWTAQIHSCPFIISSPLL